MKILFTLFFSIFFYHSYSQSDDHNKIDTVVTSIKECSNCPNETLIYHQLKCGLYINQKGDIAFKSIERTGKKTLTKNRYIEWLYNANPNETMDGGLMQLKSIIDTETFKFLNDYYWIDKYRVYGYQPMADGGTIYLNPIADPNTFKIFGKSNYAKDKSHIFYKGSIIKMADVKSFEIIENKLFTDIAKDKNYLYKSGKRMTEDEINEYKLNEIKK